MKRKRALYLGRFQPLHRGHWWMIMDALSRYELVLGIGSSEATESVQNPFSAEERLEMLRRTALATGIELPQVFLVPDIPEDDRYVDHVLSIVGSVDVLLSAEQDWTRDLFVARGYPVEYLGRQGQVSATEVRRRMQSGEDWQGLVPPAVASYLGEIDAVKRMRCL